MERRLSWTQAAGGDLRECRDFIAKESVRYADTFSETVILISETIPVFPMRGRIVPEIGDRSLRELILGPYRLIYKIENEMCFVVAFIHSAREMKRFWKKQGEQRLKEHD